MESMSRRRFLGCVGVGTTLAFGRAAGVWAAQKNGQQQPNIILIYTDDLDFDEIGVYDHVEFPSYSGAKKRGLLDKYEGRQAYCPASQVLTPHIDSLARDGAMFTRFYVTSPVCTPSRYSTITGRYASRSIPFCRIYPPGTPSCIGWDTDLDPNETNIAGTMNALGYTTGMVGKWHLTSKDDPNSGRIEGVELDADPSDPVVAKKVREGYERAVRYMRESIGFDYVASFYAGNGGTEGAPKALRVHNMEWITKGALDFIEQNAAGPFFLYMATTVPHGGAGDRYLMVDPRATPAGLLDEVPKVQPSRESVLERVKAAGFDVKNARMTWLDDGIGAILNKLDELGIADTTAVVFVSDHLSRGKYTVYESARVPALIRWPARIRPGTRIDAICANIDLAPTFAAMAGGESDAAVDGKSLLPILASGKSAIEWRESLLLEIAYAKAVVTRDWKYIAVRYPEDLLKKMVAEGNMKDYTWNGRIARDKKDGTKPAVIRYEADKDFPAYSDLDQLYNLENDPYEQTNLAADPKYARKLDEMKSMLAQNLETLPHSFGEFKARARQQENMATADVNMKRSTRRKDRKAEREARKADRNE